MNRMEDILDLPLRNILPLIQEKIGNQTQYFGIQTAKFPFDFWVYQEIIWQNKPDIIIEIGNYRGGTLLALAHFLDSVGHGKIIGIDIRHDLIPKIVRDHPRIQLITGDACSIFHEIEKMVINSKVMIIEDSDHSYDNTLNVLRNYSSIVSVGQYFIIEDSICWHGLECGPRPGPFEAIEYFLSENSNFISDRTKELFLITWNPKGYLRRVK